VEVFKNLYNWDKKIHHVICVYNFTFKLFMGLIHPSNLHMGWNRHHLLNLEKKNDFSFGSEGVSTQNILRIDGVGGCELDI